MTLMITTTKFLAMTTKNHKGTNDEDENNYNANICLGYLRAVNMWSAHNWTFIIICVTVMYHYFLLFYYPKTYDPMIRFYLGWCCGSNLSRCDEIKF